MERKQRRREREKKKREKVRGRTYPNHLRNTIDGEASICTLNNT